MASCPHEDAPKVGRACAHLLDAKHDFVEAFLGRGVESELLCERCAAADDRSAVVATCRACDHAAQRGRCSGIRGTPEVVVAESQLQIETETIAVPGLRALLDLQPIGGDDRNRWLGIDEDNVLHVLDLENRTIERSLGQAAALGMSQPRLHVAVGGRYVAIVQRHGTRGIVYDLDNDAHSIPLTRDGYCAEHCEFPFAFVERPGQTLFVHAPGWNRLELVDAETGTVLSARDAMTYETGDEQPQHYLDYFHCDLHVSPDQRRIAEYGWVWHPVGVAVAWSLDDWLTNPFESEDGPSRKQLTAASYFWDGPMCWVSPERIAVWGFGSADTDMIPSAVIYDATTGERVSWFAGPMLGGFETDEPAGEENRLLGPPRGIFYFDQHLLVLAHGRISVWDIESGARLLDQPTPAMRFHPTAHVFASLSDERGRITLSRIHRGAARWNQGAVAKLVAAGDPDSLPILADALEAAGCTDAELLAHCRTPGPHGKRCWVFDRLG